MRALHRIVVGLMLLVFTSASVLAGPLRLCIGNNDHRAIEFAVAPGNHAMSLHDHDHHRHGLDHGSSDLALHDADSSCIDIPIVQSLVISCKPQAEKKAAEPTPDPVAVFLQKIVQRTPVVPDAEPRVAPRDTSKISGLRLADLRTVILTI